MISAFRLSCIAALALFALIGVARHHRDGAEPDPIVVLARQIGTRGYVVSQPKTVLWGVPAVTVAVPGCSDAVDAIVFDFDEIMSPGILAGVMATDRGSLQVAYDGQIFPRFDRLALYRARLRAGIVGLTHTGQVADLSIILLFWPSTCTPRAIF